MLYYYKQGDREGTERGQGGRRRGEKEGDGEGTERGQGGDREGTEAGGQQPGTFGGQRPE